MPRTVKRYEHKDPALADTSGLTKRQAEIAELMAMGMTTQEIASELGISSDTVTCHMDRLKDRFHAFNKVDLICQMWMHGILQARVMSCVLVCFLCILSTFPPMARTSRPNQNNRQVVSVVRIGRKEVAAIIGGLH